MALYLNIMGVQGAGKGTQAGFIRDEYNLLHVSTGDLFRALKTREDDFARKIQAIMASGQLVSDDDTNEVLKDHLERTDLRGGVIFDGYPRTTYQAEWLDKYLAEKGEQLTAVLLLDLDLYTAFKRTFGRLVLENDKDVTYNIYYDADKITHQFVEDPNKQYSALLEGTVKATGDKLVRRAPDDANAGSIVRRIDIFSQTTAPLIDYYNKKGLLKRIPADQSKDAVLAQIKQVIEEKRKS